MAASKYIRMLHGRDRGRAVEVEYDTANYLVAQGQAEEINFAEPGALETRIFPPADVAEVRTPSASGPEVVMPQASSSIATNLSRLKRKK
jgi:hypothetical protein